MNKGKEFRATFNKLDKVKILPVVAIVLKVRISQPRRVSGKARSLVKLLQFSLGASSISVVQWS